MNFEEVYFDLRQSRYIKYEWSDRFNVNVPKVIWNKFFESFDLSKMYIYYWLWIQENLD